MLGTFLRGPNWNFFGPYEFWDVNKLVPLNNINLSEIIWIKVLKRSLPNFWLVREIFGLALVGFYIAVLPLVFSKTLLRRFYEKMDPVRYLIGVSLALIMLSLPIKMYLRWIFNLKYIVNIPEFAFNMRRSERSRVRPSARRQAKPPAEPIDHHYDIPRLNRAFWWSGAALTVVFVVMIVADYQRDWKTFQRVFLRLDAKLTREAALAARREGPRRGALPPRRRAQAGPRRGRLPRGSRCASSRRS